MKIDRTIYLDYQATTPVDPRVFDKMSPYFNDKFANPHSSDHFLGWESARAVEDAAAQIAQLIGADPDEIIFTSGATESNNLTLLGLARRATGGKRRRILLSAIEHKCVLSVGRILKEQYGFTVEEIPVDYQGFVGMASLEDMIGGDVLAVSIMAVNNEIGTIQDIEKISSLVKEYGAVLHCDAAQAPIAMPTESLARYADIVSLSGHKMYGPKGIGAACISRALQGRIEPLIYGGGQQNGLRSGTIPTALCVGMGTAAAMLSDENAEERRARLRNCRDLFVKRLRKLAWPIHLNGPDDIHRHPANLNIQFPGFSAHDILNALQPHLAASTGSACTSGIPEPSHVLRAVGLNNDEAESSIRFSLGFDTTIEDAEEAVRLIENVLEKLSNAELGQCTLNREKAR